jgi:UDP-N-acetyl-D-glucosamine dehydrogenase
VINELEKLGALVEYYDPYIKEYREHGKIKIGLGSLSKNVLKESDLTIITAAHTNLDYDFIQKNAQFIFDTKNAMKNIERRDNIELL